MFLFHKYIWSPLVRPALFNIDVLLLVDFIHSLSHGKYLAQQYNLKFGRPRPPLSFESCKIINFTLGFLLFHIKLLTVVFVFFTILIYVIPFRSHKKTKFTKFMEARIIWWRWSLWCLMYLQIVGRIKTDLKKWGRASKKSYRIWNTNRESR